MVEDPSYKVRVSAALTLGKVGGSAAVPSLIKALSDQNNCVRGIAAQSLGKIGDSRPPSRCAICCAARATPS